MRTNNPNLIMRAIFRIIGFTRIPFLAGLMIFFFASFPSPLLSASYDYYVEEGGDGDGSSDDPFGSIGDALDEISETGGDSVYVRDGGYDESFTIPDGVGIVGEGKGDVIVSGTVRMEDDTELRNLTVTEGGIVALDGADVEIVDVRIEDTDDIGIDAEKGKGTVVVRDCVIEHGRKGLYIQAGRTIRMSGTEVEENAEEGLDIRENVSGIVEGSVFRDNEESGIEVILGSSEIVIRNNRITGNGSSGIATQYVPVSKKTGDVRIEGNVMRENDNYGIDCKIPQGGPDSGTYFLNSLAVSGNDISGNGKGDIASRCRVLTEEELAAIAEAEARTNEEEEERVASLSMSEEETANRNQGAALARKRSEDIREAAEYDRVETVRVPFEAAIARLEAEAARQAGMSAFSRFLYGDVRSDRELREGVADLDVLRERLSDEMSSLDFPENVRFAETVLDTSAERVAMIGETLSGVSPLRFSLFGWLRRLSLSERQPVALSDEELGLSFFPASAHPSVIFVGELSYHPGLRSRIVESGDDAYFSGIEEELSAYDVAVGTVTSPMLGEDDPVPSAGRTTSMPIPSRFANVFAARNVRVFDVLGLSRKDPDGAERTATYLSDAGGELPGSYATGPAVIGYGRNSIAVFPFAESTAIAGEDFLAALDGADGRYGAVTVLIDWDPTSGTEPTPARTELLRGIAEKGVDLIVGSGVSFPDPTSDVPYREIGDIFRAATVAGAEPGAFVILTLDASGNPEVSERTVSVPEAGVILLSEPLDGNAEPLVSST